MRWLFNSKFKVEILINCNNFEALNWLNTLN
jgi:hypothetical protein